MLFPLSNKELRRMAEAEHDRVKDPLVCARSTHPPLSITSLTPHGCPGYCQAVSFTRGSQQHAVHSGAEERFGIRPGPSRWYARLSQRGDAPMRDTKRLIDLPNKPKLG